MSSDYGYSNQYVRNCHMSCVRLGCQYKSSVELLALAQEAIKQEESRKVASEWCEVKTTELPEGHPFNGKNGKVVFDRTIYSPDGHMDSSGSITFCLKHGADTGLIPKGEPADIINGEITSGG